MLLERQLPPWHARQRNTVLVVRLVLGLLFLFGLLVEYRQYQTFKQIDDLWRIQSTMITVAANADFTRRVDGLCSRQASRADEAWHQRLQALQDGMLQLETCLQAVVETRRHMGMSSQHLSAVAAKGERAAQYIDQFVQQLNGGMLDILRKAGQGGHAV